LSKNSLLYPVLLSPNVYLDERGWFYEAYNSKDFSDSIIFIQDNHSLSLKKGTMRGLHLQLPPFEQAKFIRVLSGRILDLVVDLRRNSKDFLRLQTFVLDSKEKNGLFIPRGFAHGFITLEDDTEVYYKVDNTYSKDHELTLSFDDSALNFNHGFDISTLIRSAKDKSGLSLEDVLKRIEENK